MAIGSQYHQDELHFSNYSVMGSQPEFLATVATLRGLQPGDVERARVLELGCASGGNLIPLAERYPDSKFVGIDLSERHLGVARQAVSELRMTNVEFRRQNLLELNADVGKFDYIIAHGLYSWTDAATRDKVLAVCREHLAPHGVAYVSYNVYPGWHVHDMFRAMMTYHARGAAGGAQRIAKGRELLEFLKSSLPAEQAPYNALIANELEPLLKQSDAALRHDLLADVSHPVYFQQFVAHAESNGLQFLGDCTQGTRYADVLSPEIEQDLGKVANDWRRKAQYRDVLLKKSFRQSLLCHAGLELLTSPTPQLVGTLYVEGPLRPEKPNLMLRSNNLERFIARNNLFVSTTAPIVKAALLYLGEIWPDCVAFDELVAIVQSRFAALPNPPPPIAPADIERLQESLLECAAGGTVDLHVKKNSFTTTVSQRPLASPVSRWQAAQDEVITNRRHAPLRLDQFDRQVLLMLDGTLDHAQLVDMLVEWASQGRISISEAQQNVDDPERARQLLELGLPRVLAHLANHALLVA